MESGVRVLFSLSPHQPHPPLPTPSYIDNVASVIRQFV